ncbi:hypothetical protein [Thermococcus thioreducens]|uniref:Uncharacterized protein n=1 Tax=Thermococcus thioreducens TaxID=277988 RepID=A0A0Q2MTN7_9EURY|nr:hypothetical protein [Thermococcus thioreducens]ASJ12396.1 hypothetical protein A3L14_05595 [Thermococcus thioreducens]KQH83127.1 hypothetical protein AMR53_02600 [Thermococcus thioreducens]SEV91557.1 hypothetical protein SAMN05216170_0838 [Thermococcus thioreducens]
MEEVIRLVEEAGVKIPKNIKTHGSPQSLQNYLKARKKLIEIQVSALEEKVISLQEQLEERKRQLEILERVIEELGGDVG